MYINTFSTMITDIWIFNLDLTRTIIITIIILINISVFARLKIVTFTDNVSDNQLITSREESLITYLVICIILHERRKFNYLLNFSFNFYIYKILILLSCIFFIVYYFYNCRENMILFKKILLFFDGKFFSRLLKS